MAQSNGTDTGSPELMAALTKLLEGVQTPKAKRARSKGKQPKSSPEEKAARQAANDAECIKVFTAAGFKNVEPRFTVMTYKKWIEKGRLVRKGEKSHRVGPFNLFHLDQTDEIPVATETKH